MKWRKWMKMEKREIKDEGKGRVYLGGSSPS